MKEDVSSSDFKRPLSQIDRQIYSMQKYALSTDDSGFKSTNLQTRFNAQQNNFFMQSKGDTDLHDSNSNNNKQFGSIRLQLA